MHTAFFHYSARCRIVNCVFCGYFHGIVFFPEKFNHSLCGFCGIALIPAVIAEIIAETPVNAVRSASYTARAYEFTVTVADYSSCILIFESFKAFQPFSRGVHAFVSGIIHKFSNTLIACPFKYVLRVLNGVRTEDKSFGFKNRHIESTHNITL